MYIIHASGNSLKWKNEQWAMGIPSRLINVGNAVDTPDAPRLTELLDANPMPEISQEISKDGSAVESAEQQNKRKGRGI